jgi:hypothetical protein
MQSLYCGRSSPKAAVHETLWGTVGGAWESGEHAADAAIKRLGGGDPRQGRS